jgi:hypothetical protein
LFSRHADLNHRTGVREAQCTLVGGALLALEVQFPGERDLQLTQGRGVTREWRWRDAIVGEVLARGITTGRNLRSAGRGGDTGFGQSRAGTGRRDLKTRAVTQSVANELIKPRVAKHRPLLVTWPGVGADRACSHRR